MAPPAQHPDLDPALVRFFASAHLVFHQVGSAGLRLLLNRDGTHLISFHQVSLMLWDLDSG